MTTDWRRGSEWGTRYVRQANASNEGNVKERDHALNSISTVLGDFHGESMKVCHIE